MITDRLRFTVFEVNTNRILARDLVVKDPQVISNLSAPSSMMFKVAQGEQYASSNNISWKNWGQWVVCEQEYNGVSEIFCYGIVIDNKVDPMNGELSLQIQGPMGYPKTIPWLENFNPIAVDPFEVVQRVWAYLQSFENSQLGIEVGTYTYDSGNNIIRDGDGTPILGSSSGTQMLPGFNFDGNTLTFDFYAMFVRMSDFPDSGDMITGLARDLPFDMIEKANWNAARTELHKQIILAYPYGGVQQESLTFRFGDNVISATQADEAEIMPVSDVIVRSWQPGKVYSAQISDVDMTRARRVVMEETVNIDSTERAAAWAKRRLQRRNVPNYFSKIVIDPNHPSGPLGSFHVGDSIRVQAPDFPWVGTIDQWHRVLSITYAETSSGSSGQQGGGGGQSTPPGMVELALKVEGAFNYEPIYYDPNYAEQPVTDLNRLSNGYFDESLAGWTPQRGQWFRVATITYSTDYNTNAGSVRIDCDDLGERLVSHRASCTAGEHLKLCVAIRWQTVTSGSDDAFQLIAFTSLDSVPVGSFVVDQITNPNGTQGWHLLEMDDWVVPNGVNEVAFQFNVTSGVTAGIAWWTFARVVPST